MIEQSIQKLCDLLSEQWRRQYPKSDMNTLTYSVGKKYYKLIQDNAVYCFIDKDGNVYKSASWKAPAKGIRFHIDQLIEQPQLCDMFGSFLYLK
jgi:hypothetical protein